MIIAIDVALNKSGVAITTDSKKFKTLTITVPERWKYYRKIEKLSEEFDRLFETYLPFEEDVTLIMEGRLKAGWSGSTLASIEGARVTAYLSFIKACKSLGRDVKMETYPPDEVKEYIAGKRNAGKEAMLKAASSRYSFLKRLEYQEDEFDAIYLILHHNNLVGKDKKPRDRSTRRRKK